MPESLTVDADTHIIESEQMWDLMDKDLQPRRPLLVQIPEGTVFRDRNAFWLIDGKIHPKPVGEGSFLLHTPADAAFEMNRTDTARESREITDVSARLADMDRLGIDVQVIYPTFFLQPVTHDVSLQVGLCRAYNQFLANVWAESGGRIRWVAMPPLLSPQDTADEIAFGKANGACGVLMHGVEELGSAGNRAYYNVYANALEHDLAIGIHLGTGSTSLSNEGLNLSQICVMLAFRDIVLNGVPEEFPGLRFGFIEAGSSWLGYAFHFLARLRKARTTRILDPYSSKAPLFSDLMRQANLYVAAQADEDLSYIFSIAAPENLVIGSDYGHVDQAFEEQMAATLREREDVDQSQVEAMLSVNSMSLYGIKADELTRTPASASAAS